MFPDDVVAITNDARMCHARVALNATQHSTARLETMIPGHHNLQVFVPCSLAASGFTAAFVAKSRRGTVRPSQGPRRVDPPKEIEVRSIPL